MRVLVTGAKGQLGQDVVQLFSRDHDVNGFGRQELDVTNERQTQAVIQGIQPTVIIHTAAYTVVDKAEDEKEKAFAVNALGTKNIAIAAESVGAKLCYISTDYVFDGTATMPYREDAPINPQSVYGQSKLAGEKLARTHCQRTFIVRTSWVFGKHGNNFVKTMLQLAESGRPLRVVNDQVGSPTYTKDLSAFIHELVQTNKYGLYHASNCGSCSWYEFAQSVFKHANLDVDLQPCTTKEFPRPAPRPAYSVLAHEAIQNNGFSLLRPWDEALKTFLNELDKNSYLV